MNTRIYKNNERWGEPAREREQVRSATSMERAKSRAAGYSAIAVLVVLCLAVVFAAVALNAPKRQAPAEIPNEPVAVPIAFALPIAGEFTITKYYADNKLQWNETAKQWQGFKAMNVQAEMGQAIVATYAGTITEVSSNAMYGTVVKIQHRDGLMTVYSGLDAEVNVKKGDYVEKGQHIGKFGDTLKLEAKEGPTLRIEVFKDGKKVNPADYIAFGENK